MRQFKRYGLATGLATLLVLGVAGCGGSDTGNQTPRVNYSSVVSFGDSLSDPGAYKVGPVAAAGGGLFTVNGITGAVGADPTPTYTWAQLVAAAVVGTPSCAARTGGFGVSATTVAGCTNYAQGGSRITNPVGTGYDGANGAMTEPVVTQVTNFLASTGNGRFTGRELVTVQAGANELFAQSDILTTAATQAGGATFVSTLAGLLAVDATNPSAAGPIIAAAMATEAADPNSTSDSIVAAGLTAAFAAGNTQVASSAYYLPKVATANSAGLAAAASYVTNTGGPNAVLAMAAVAVELADSVKGMLESGATKIVVSNLPDVSLTPYALALDSPTRQLVSAMTQAFNASLRAELAGVSGVLFVDVYTENQRQVANPSQFGLSNVTASACATGPSNPSGSSLFCKPSNLIAGNTSRYLFADGVHPTPYGHKLLSQLIIKQLVLAGWL
jgi:phospholipase/lecithinase/hemolysin